MVCRSRRKSYKDFKPLLVCGNIVRLYDANIDRVDICIKKTTAEQNI